MPIRLVLERLAVRNEAEAFDETQDRSTGSADRRRCYWLEHRPDAVCRARPAVRADGVDNEHVPDAHGASEARCGRRENFYVISRPGR